MTANEIRNRNNIIDNLSYALKMSAYIDADNVRKGTEQFIVDCIKNVVSMFNVKPEQE